MSCWGRCGSVQANRIWSTGSNGGLTPKRKSSKRTIKAFACLPFLTTGPKNLRVMCGAIGAKWGHRHHGRSPFAASTIAKPPRRTTSGRSAHASITAASPGSETASGADGAQDSAPPVFECATFPGVLVVGSSPSTGIAVLCVFTFVHLVILVRHASKKLRSYGVSIGFFGAHRKHLDHLASIASGGSPLIN